MIAIVFIVFIAFIVCNIAALAASEYRRETRATCLEREAALQADDRARRYAATTAANDALWSGHQH